MLITNEAVQKMIAAAIAADQPLLDYLSAKNKVPDVWRGASEYWSVAGYVSGYCEAAIKYRKDFIPVSVLEREALQKVLRDYLPKPEGTPA